MLKPFFDALETQKTKQLKLLSDEINKSLVSNATKLQANPNKAIMSIVYEGGSKRGGGAGIGGEADFNVQGFCFKTYVCLFCVLFFK